MSTAESHAQRILSVLNQQRALGKLCDTALSASDGLVRLAHRNILACFSDMFQEDMPHVQGAVQVVTLKDCPDEGLELLLDFIYTGELPLDSSNSDKVQLAASSLCVSEVIAKCQEISQKPQETVKRKRGRPKKKAELTTGTVLELEILPAAETDEASVNASGDGKITTTTRSGRVVNCPKRLRTQEEETTPAKNQNAEIVIVIEPDVETPKANHAAGDTESQQQVDPTFMAPLERGDGPEDDPDFEDFVENSLDSWDHDYEPDTSAPATSTTEKRKTKVKSAQKENGGSGASGGVQCPVCNKSFKSKYYLKVHNRRHTGEKPFVCGKCGKRYFRKENLLEHEAKNCAVTPQTHTCPTCSETFPRKSQLTAHMVTHTGEMPNKCPVCSEQFMLKKHLTHHMTKLHGFPKPHQCPECDKSFMTKSELRIHDSSKHKGEKPFVCEECGHRASSRNGLKMHIKALHRHDKPFVCTECGHAFTQKNNLTMHMLVHSGERPFQCHLCGKTFRTQGTLDKHNRTHTGERPFSCEFCQQRFTEKGAMLRHVESKHQEGRPHTCSICGKTFKAREQLRVHMNRHKGERKFECKDCGYKFTRQAHLRRHAIVHKRTENYKQPKQRKFRNIIVDDLEDTSSIMSSVKIVQALLKKKTTTKKKRMKKKKKPKSKTIITTEEDTGDSYSDWIPGVDLNEKQTGRKMPVRKAKKKESLKKTEELQHEPAETDLGQEPMETELQEGTVETNLSQGPIETEESPNLYESTVDMSQIADEMTVKHE
uniref:Zinc finger protein 865 n=1 Tax=Neogobius melanostomus TaxID=47308 RepID=A0A8C6U8D5_9GOBI